MDPCYELFQGQRYRRKVRAVVIDTDQRALLIQPHGYKADTWTLVGGGVEAGETDAQAMRRELAEEAGLHEILVLQLAAHRHRFLFSDKARQQRNLDHDGQSAAIFLARVQAGVPVVLQAAEVKASCWVPLSEADVLLKVDAQRQLFRLVLAEFKSCNGETHGTEPA
ncbi:MAG TPA: NUDIX hydrolase [Pseudorhodoferax sp.]|nr:NUDIX hydrolase [Pseudorhodoferax sp.]